MRKIMRWGTVPLLVLFAASCTDENPITGPEAGSQIATVSSPSNVLAGTTTTVDLLAGQDILVGEVNVTHNGDGTVTIEYVMDAGFCLTETHWEANYDVGNLVNGGGNPQVGQFAYGDDTLDCVSSYMETAAILPEDGSGDYVVAAHAVVMGSEENPFVVFGTYDVEGDGPEEGDIYGINPTSGNLVLAADIDNDATGDQFYPNALALDRATETLFFVSDDGDADGEDLYSVPAVNADPTMVTVTEVWSGLSGGRGIHNATIDADFFYYVPTGTDDLWRAPLDGSADGSAYCSLGFGDGMLFGDIAATPDGGIIYGVGRLQTSGDMVFFEVDVDGTDDCSSTGSTTFANIDPTSYDFQLQISFGDDGTLYAQRAISTGSDAGQWYTLNPATGEIDMTLATSARSFTDIAGGLPFEPSEFEETAWGEGNSFSGRSWAMFMGPFTIE